MEERKGLYICIKKVLVPILTVALVSTSALLISGGLSVGSVAYAAGDTVTVKASLKSIDSTTTDKVELTVSISENAAALSGIQMRIIYPEEFDIIETKDYDFFENGISFFGEDGANPMYCSFGSHGTDVEPRESTDKTSGDLVKFTFKANQILETGKEYTFGIEDKDSNENITLEAFVLKTDEDGYPWTYYLNVVDASPELKYTPTTSGGNGGEGVTVSGTAVSWNNTNNAVYRLYPGDTDDTAIKTDIKLDGSGIAGAINPTSKGEITSNADAKRFDQTFSFDGVAAGTYKLAVYKPGGYVTTIKTIEVANTTVTENVEMWLLGDVNGSGTVTADDLTSLARHVAKIQLITKVESLGCADVTNDGTVSADDLTKLARYIAKIIISLE